MRYRKKPVVIEAFEWGGRDIAKSGRVLGWFMAHDFKDFMIVDDGAGDLSLEMKTHGKTETAAVGDMVICGFKGEFFPQTADSFFSEYDPARAAVTAATDALWDAVTGIAEETQFPTKS
jgi:hypothetical protein